MALVERVYKDRSNPNDVLFSEDGSPMDFSAVTRVVCQLKNSAGAVVATIDSDSSPSLISWTDTSVSPNVLNVITFNLNSYNFTGLHAATVYVYDPSHEAGQIIAHPKAPTDDGRLFFDFVNA